MIEGGRIVYDGTAADLKANPEQAPLRVPAARSAATPPSCSSMSTPTDEARDPARLVENWVVWRDAGDWERFRTVWHDDGRMMATWFQGSCDDFIRVSREGFERGVRILHFLGGTSVDVAGARGVAQTKMTITQRAEVEGVECDVVCTGRFYDFVERRDGRWGIVLRQPIYESGPDHPGRPVRARRARPRAARVVSGRLPAPRLPPDAERLHGQAGHAGADRARGRGAVRERREVAFGRESRPMSVARRARGPRSPGSALRADRARLEPRRAGRLHRRAPRAHAAARPRPRARVDRRCSTADAGLARAGAHAGVRVRPRARDARRSTPTSSSRAGTSTGAWAEIDFDPPVARRLRKDWSWLGIA